MTLKGVYPSGRITLTNFTLRLTAICTLSLFLPSDLNTVSYTIGSGL